MLMYKSLEVEFLLDNFGGFALNDLELIVFHSVVPFE